MEVGIVTDFYYDKNYLERPMQQLYPLKLTYDVTATSQSSNEKLSTPNSVQTFPSLNPNAMLKL